MDESINDVRILTYMTGRGGRDGARAGPPANDRFQHNRPPHYAGVGLARGGRGGVSFRLGARGDGFHSGECVNSHVYEASGGEFGTVFDVDDTTDGGSFRSNTHVHKFPEILVLVHM